ncbi:hypothetical protein H2203_001813 [Taxawa tesnikishii (nom. ined.)]|nr:hypothetical protein H2203_001813 [Dothideales sp. JES 119]
MAPWNDDRDSNRRQQDASTATEAPERKRPQDEDNPFIAFRRFADEQFNTLIQGFNAIPDMLSNAKARADEQHRQWEQHLRDGKDKFDEEMSQVWKDFGGLQNTPLGWGGWGRRPERAAEGAKMVTVTDEAREAAKILIFQASNANRESNVDPKKVLSLFRDNGDTMDAPWLSVDWFKNSPYSPLQLERHKHLHQQGSMWRAAFEDLMCAHLGKELSAWEAWFGRVNNQKLYATWAQPGMDWMLGLQCRGVLPPQLPSLYQLHPFDSRERNMLFNDAISGRHRWGWPSRLVKHDFEALAREVADTSDLEEETGTAAEKATNEGKRAMQDHRRGLDRLEADDKQGLQAHPKPETPQTELDAYERFLGKAHETGAQTESQQPLSAAQPQQQTKPASSQQPEQEIAPQESQSTVLSTLTTTEQTTLPDGTVTTKVVLKKRFSDGREESTETVSTTHGRRQENAGAQQAVASSKEPAKEAAPQQKKGSSWFWF